MKNDEKNFTENFDLPLVEEQEYIRAKKNVTLHNFRKELESDFLRFVKYTVSYTHLTLPTIAKV